MKDAIATTANHNDVNDDSGGGGGVRTTIIWRPMCQTLCLALLCII